MSTQDPALHRRQARRRQSDRFAPVFNPATGEQSGSVPLASAAEVDEAVAAGAEGVSRPGR